VQFERKAFAKNAGWKPLAGNSAPENRRCQQYQVVEHSVKNYVQIQFGAKKRKVVQYAKQQFYFQQYAPTGRIVFYRAAAFSHGASHFCYNCIIFLQHLD
jgi:hypothetical protein